MIITHFFRSRKSFLRFFVTIDIALSITLFDLTPAADVRITATEKQCRYVFPSAAGVRIINAKKQCRYVFPSASGVHALRAGKTKAVYVHSTDKKRESSCPTTVSDDDSPLRYRLSSQGEIHKRGNRRGHMLAYASILSAAPSYARFSFRRFLFRVKRKW